MNTMEMLNSAFESIKDKIPFKPAVGLVLGSGLGDFVENKLTPQSTLPYDQIKNFPVSTIVGHKGQFVFAHIGKVPTVIMQGRVHFYEGYPITDVVLPIRLMGLMGIKALFLSNAAGGVNADFQPGDLMVIQDQIAALVPSPLMGRNLSELGTRFPDMSTIYDLELIEAIENNGSKLGIPLKKGVYLQFTGPQYESPAEIRMARTFGADVVGMSTACEAIAANHMGIRVCGISCVTNLAAGMSSAPLNHEEVQEVATMSSANFQSLVYNSISDIGEIL